MSIQNPGNPSVQAQVEPTTPPISPLARLSLFLVFLLCSVSIFLLGTNVYELFPTNNNLTYSICLSAGFLLVTLLLKRTPKSTRYWQVLYAFFIASMVNLVSILMSNYAYGFRSWFRITTGTNQALAVEKLYYTLLAVITILVLTRLAGGNMGSIFLKRGNQHKKWGWFVGLLVLFHFFSSALIFFGTGYSTSSLGGVILWGLVFALSNSLLEELWFRGIFLNKLVPLIGATATIVLTSIWFALLHLLSVAYLPAVVVPIFLVNTLCLGVTCGVLMLKTDSLWGAFLVHAAADLFLWIALLAIH